MQNNRKGFVLLPVLLFILIVGVVGYFIYQNYLPKDHNYETQPSLSPSPVQNLSPTSTTNSPDNKTINENKYEILFKSRHFTPDADINSGLNWLVSQDDNLLKVHGIIQLYQAPQQQVKQKLEAGGFDLQSYIPNNAWLGAISIPIHDPKAPELLLIRWLGPLVPQDKMDKKLWQGEIGDWAIIDNDKVALELSYFPDVTENEVRAIINNYQGIVTDSYANSPKLVIELPKENIRSVATEDVIMWIGVISPPPTTN